MKTRNGSRRPAQISRPFASALACVGFLWLYSVANPVAVQNLPTPSQTVWDRVFSAEQAGRGESTYLDECGRCHTETLAGGDFGPPVVGAIFWDQWKGKTVADIVDRLRSTMPQDNPGRLNPSQTVDVVAFLMKSNGFPVGDKPLSSEPAVLQAIAVTSAR